MLTDAEGRPILPPRPPAKRRGNPETKLQGSILKAINKLPGCIAWRNNVGVVERADGIPLRFGLAPGSSDIIGIYKGKFLAIEVKTPTGRVTAEQSVFLATVKAHGGLAGVCRSLDDALKLLELKN